MHQLKTAHIHIRVLQSVKRQRKILQVVCFLPVKKNYIFRTIIHTANYNLDETHQNDAVQRAKGEKFVINSKPSGYQDLLASFALCHVADIHNLIVKEEEEEEKITQLTNENIYNKARYEEN